MFKLLLRADSKGRDCKAQVCPHHSGAVMRAGADSEIIFGRIFMFFQVPLLLSIVLPATCFFDGAVSALELLRIGTLSPVIRILHDQSPLSHKMISSLLTIDMTALIEISF